MGIKLKTDATVEPVSTATAKLWTRIESDADDSIVAMLIKGARRAAEQYCGRYFAPRTVTLYLDAFPPAEIMLPRPPVIQVDSVKYVDTAGTLTTIASANYTCEQAHGDPPARAWLMPAYDYEWPETREVANAVEIQYQCGYATCPDDVVEYILAHLAATYGQREAIARSDRVQQVVPFIASKLDPYVIPSI